MYPLNRSTSARKRRRNARPSAHRRISRKDGAISRWHLASTRESDRTNPSSRHLVLSPFYPSLRENFDEERETKWERFATTSASTRWWPWASYFWWVPLASLSFSLCLSNQYARVFPPPAGHLIHRYVPCRTHVFSLQRADDFLKFLFYKLYIIYCRERERERVYKFWLKIRSCETFCFSCSSQSLSAIPFRLYFDSMLILWCAILVIRLHCLQMRSIHGWINYWILLVAIEKLNFLIHFVRILLLKKKEKRFIFYERIQDYECELRGGDRVRDRNIDDDLKCRPKV